MTFRVALTPVLLFLATVFISSCSHQFGPGEVGVWYEFQEGDSLEEIAQKYGVDSYHIKKRNEIYEAEDLDAGMIIFIPGYQAEPPPEQETQKTTKRSSPKVSPRGQVKFPKLKPSDPIGRSGKRFIWPASGSLTSRYGRRNGRKHEGIDIGKDKGDAIKAAGRGVVEFAGRQRGYGNVLIINHGRGIKTLYAHLARDYVRQGQRVRQGQKIAKIGNSGRSSGPHLHFEVRVHGRARNPLAYLPLR